MNIDPSSPEEEPDEEPYFLYGICVIVIIIVLGFAAGSV